MAENYHNIWAKKKKSDLGSRGDSLMKPIMDKQNEIHTLNKDKGYRFVEGLPLCG